jgi:hypothetical protein
MTEVPDPPEPLDGAGRALWAAVVADYDMRPDELQLLASACRTADHIAAIERALDGQPLTVLGSAKQLTAHPLLTELRQYRAAQAALFRQLSLADLDDDMDGEEPAEVRPLGSRMTRSESARLAAQTRWSRRGTR